MYWGVYVSLAIYITIIAIASFIALRRSKHE